MEKKKILGMNSNICLALGWIIPIFGIIAFIIEHKKMEDEEKIHFRSIIVYTIIVGVITGVAFLLSVIDKFFLYVFLAFDLLFVVFAVIAIIRAFMDKPYKVPLCYSLAMYRRLPNKKKNAITGYIYILPWIIGFIMFGAYLVVLSVRISMADNVKYVVNTDLGASELVIEGFGFKQFIQIFKDNPDHVDTILSVIKDVAIVVPLVVIFALILALLLKNKLKGIGIFRTIFFIPVILLSGNMLSYFTQYGLLTMPGVASGNVSSLITFYFPSSIGEVISYVFGKIILILWLSGVQTIIFLAGLNRIDKTVYEAATMEGASGWDSFWKITLPAISGFLIINVIYTTVIYCNLSNNGLVTLINNVMTSANYGRDYASALSWILFLIELLIIGVYSLIIKLIFRRYH